MNGTAAGRLVRIGAFGAIGAAMAVIESSWPHPLPWVRLGIGNAAAVIVLWSDGGRAALAVLGLKLGVAGLVGGTLFQPVALVGVAASMAAWGGMLLVRSAARNVSFFGPVGASAFGALAYGLVQVWLVGLWLVRAPLWDWAWMIVAPGVVAGAATGVVAALVVRRLGYWTAGEGARAA